jgi:hypothetical protein
MPKAIIFARTLTPFFAESIFNKHAAIVAVREHNNCSDKRDGHVPGFAPFVSSEIRR